MENVDSEVFDHRGNPGLSVGHPRTSPAYRGITNHRATSRRRRIRIATPASAQKRPWTSVEFAGLRLAAELGIDDTFSRVTPAWAALCATA